MAMMRAIVCGVAVSYVLTTMMRTTLSSAMLESSTFGECGGCDLGEGAGGGNGDGGCRGVVSGGGNGGSIG